MALTSLVAHSPFKIKGKKNKKKPLNSPLFIKGWQETKSPDGVFVVVGMLFLGGL
jgi:hypothetical protein